MSCDVTLNASCCRMRVNNENTSFLCTNHIWIAFQVGINAQCSLPELPAYYDTKSRCLYGVLLPVARGGTLVSMSYRCAVGSIGFLFVLPAGRPAPC